MTTFATLVVEAGGVGAPNTRLGQLRTALRAELARGSAELDTPRAGYDGKVTVDFAAGDGCLLAVCPLASSIGQIETIGEVPRPGRLEANEV